MGDPARLPLPIQPAVEDALSRLAERMHRIHEDLSMVVGELQRLRVALGVADEFEDSELGDGN